MHFHFFSLFPFPCCKWISILLKFFSTFDGVIFFPSWKLFSFQKGFAIQMGFDRSFFFQRFCVKKKDISGFCVFSILYFCFFCPVAGGFIFCSIFVYILVVLYFFLLKNFRLWLVCFSLNQSKWEKIWWSCRSPRLIFPLHSHKHLRVCLFAL